MIARVRSERLVIDLVLELTEPLRVTRQSVDPVLDQQRQAPLPQSRFAILFDKI